MTHNDPDPKSERPVRLKDEEIERIDPLSGADRGGLGEKGWAEVSADRIGGILNSKIPERSKDRMATSTVLVPTYHHEPARRAVRTKHDLGIARWLTDPNC